MASQVEHLTHQVKTWQCASSLFGTNVKSYRGSASNAHALQQIKLDYFFLELALGFDLSLFVVINYFESRKWDNAQQDFSLHSSIGESGK